MEKSNLELLNKLQQKGKNFLGVKYPIICGAMTWMSTPQLNSSVGEAGAFDLIDTLSFTGLGI